MSLKCACARLIVLEVEVLKHTDLVLRIQKRNICHCFIELNISMKSSHSTRTRLIGDSMS